MALAKTRTRLSLDRWAQLIGIHPAHFNGVYYGGTPTVCEQPWFQEPWQAVDRVGREEVAQAIQKAEADIEKYLGYHLLPTYEIDEWRPTVRPSRPELTNLSSTDLRGHGQIAFANWGYLITGGVRLSVPHEADVDIVWSDEDGDNYDEIGTIEVAVVAGQRECEMHVYYPVSDDMVLEGGLEEWEIRPINVTIVGLLATIRFRREQCVLPIHLFDYFPPDDDSHIRGVDGGVVGNFLETVDVYRVYNDPQTQVTLMWEPFGSSGCDCCGGTGCELCAYTTQTGCLMLRGDPRQSIAVYHPGTWNVDTLEFDSAAFACSRQPDIVRLYYLSGWMDKRLPCPHIQMDRDWERVVAYYAASLLDRPVCECNNIRSWVTHWQKDLAIRGEEGQSISRKLLDNPFGTLRGAVFAWQRVNSMNPPIGEGVLL